MPLLQFDGALVQRSHSQISLLSVKSAGSSGNVVSASSNATADAIRVGNDLWEEIFEFFLEQTRNIDRITAEVKDILDSSNVQKNVNMTITDGLKKITELVSTIDRDHKLAKIKENLYRTVL